MGCRELKVYYKPCRKKPRVYSVCDVRRIVRYAAESNSRQDVIANAGDALGFFNLVSVDGLNESELVKLAETLDAAKKILKILEGIPAKGWQGWLLRIGAKYIIAPMAEAAVSIAVELVQAIITDRLLVRLNHNCRR